MIQQATIPCVAYYRMSSDKQECSIKDQRAEVLKMAKRGSYRILRDYGRAELFYDRALEIAPDDDGAYAVKAYLPLYRDGDVEMPKAALEDPLMELGEDWRWGTLRSTRLSMSETMSRSLANSTILCPRSMRRGSIP